MDAIINQLQAIKLTTPYQNTTRGQKKANCCNGRCKYASKTKPKYNSATYQIRKDATNRCRVVARANKTQRTPRQASIVKYNIKWDQQTGKFY